MSETTGAGAGAGAAGADGAGAAGDEATTATGSGALGAAGSGSEVAVGLVAPSRDAAHFMLLLREQLGRLALRDPVRAIALEANGVVPLAGAIALGPRLGRVFARDGGGPMLPHNIILGAVGGLILWFGWYGFNPGSTLSAMDTAGIGRVATNTTLAAAAGGGRLRDGSIAFRSAGSVEARFRLSAGSATRS